jgi:hypothetical protein
MNIFIESFASEWLKKKRTASSFLIIVGSFLIPAILIIARSDSAEGLANSNRGPHVWEMLFNRNWQIMAAFLLPMGIVLVTSLITQLEFRNNTWKQLCTTPQSDTVIFFVKLAVILVMLLEFFVLFNFGIWISGVIPSLFFKSVSGPAESLPLGRFLAADGRFLLNCLPIVSLQYLLSLRFRNFLLPLGAGLGLYVASMVAVHWRYGYTIPYTYCAFNFYDRPASVKGINTDYWAAGYTVGFMVLAYIIYITRNEKG